MCRPIGDENFEMNDEIQHSQTEEVLSAQSKGAAFTSSLFF